MESQKVVAVVEEAAAARAALEWAARNYIRGGDTVTLLHVCPRAASKKKQRSLRLRGFQLALAFRELCDGVAQAKVEIIVTEGDEIATIASVINKIGATTLVAGLHDQSFLYRAQDPSYGVRSFGCRVLAIKQHPAMREGFINAEFFQIETARLCYSISEPKIPYQIFPLSFGMICKRSRRRK